MGKFFVPEKISSRDNQGMMVYVLALVFMSFYPKTQNMRKTQKARMGNKRYQYE